MRGKTAPARDRKRVRPPRVGFAVLSGSLALNVLALGMPLVMLQTLIASSLMPLRLH